MGGNFAAQFLYLILKKVEPRKSIEAVLFLQRKKHDIPSASRSCQTRLDPTFVVAFPGGHGTADMIQRAVKVGVPVKIVE